LGFQPSEIARHTATERCLQPLSGIRSQQVPVSALVGNVRFFQSFEEGIGSYDLAVHSARNERVLLDRVLPCSGDLESAAERALEGGRGK
jgi:hypothetical protein